MRTWTSVVVAALCVVVLAGGAVAQSKDYYSVVLENNDQFHVVEGKADGALAYGFLQPLMNKTGWSNLAIFTSEKASDDEQMYAAGYLEAYLTHEQMYLGFVNVYGTGGFNSKIVDFLESNIAYTEKMVTANRNTSSYWNHVGLVMTQFMGLYEGFVQFHGDDLSFIDVWAMSANGDIETLDPIYASPAGSDPNTFAEAGYGSHCSGLVKLTADMEEIFIGHSTWNTYNSMLRIYKYLYAPLSAKDTAAVSVSYPSYPGALNSIDDMYAMSSQLAVVETTNGCMNSSLWHYVTPDSGVTTWIRTVVANRMASTSQQWVDVFSTSAAPLYLNQWFVLNYNLFTPGGELQDNLLWVLEQRPGKIYSEDITTILEYGYWPSYNVPFFKENYDICEFAESEEKYGPYLFSYDKAARAEIFRRNQTDVTDLDSFAALMRYNDYEHDPFSIGPGGVPNAGLGISSRFDLVTGNPNNKYLDKNAFGATDTKATSYALMKSGTPFVYAQSGPTHDQQPPFSWADWPKVTHLGMPTVYDFDFYMMDFFQGE